MKVFLFCGQNKQYKFVSMIVVVSDLEQALEVFFKDNPKENLFDWEYKNVTLFLNEKGFTYKEKTND